MLTEILQRMGFHPDKDKPRVGVSACLLGRPVRYNGERKYNAWISDELPALFQLVETCPEVGIGLPVPRPPIQVVRVVGSHRVRGVHAPEQDFTDALSGYADGIATGLDGFIVKARSPSCGFGTAPLHDPRGNEIGTSDGAFTARLRERFASLPMCDEEALASEAGRLAFVLAVFRYRHEQAPTRGTAFIPKPPPGR